MTIDRYSSHLVFYILTSYSHYGFFSIECKHHIIVDSDVYACDSMSVCLSVWFCAWALSTDNIPLKIMKFDSAAISNIIWHYRQSLACFQKNVPQYPHILYHCLPLWLTHINVIYQLTFDLLYEVGVRSLQGLVMFVQFNQQTNPFLSHHLFSICFITTRYNMLIKLSVVT